MQTREETFQPCSVAEMQAQKKTGVGQTQISYDPNRKVTEGNVKQCLELLPVEIRLCKDIRKEIQEEDKLAIQFFSQHSVLSGS